ncbi:MAG: diguanylate cyclase [Anaerolineales bacterium]|nr:diguanylate cyclase [Chloroflexota bacterium]MBL6982928.1 diguanylate cyclase [Anaerolineales bacterium]
MKVLTLIADSPDFQRFVKRVTADGFEIIKAKDQTEAREILLEKQIHAAVIDFEIASAELVSRIREVGVKDYIYVFGLLSKGVSSTIERKSGFMADEYIYKPMEPDELIARLVVVDRYLKTLTKIRARQKYPDPIRDFVTGTFSQTTIHELLTTEISRSRRTRKNFVLAIISLDGATNIPVEFSKATLESALAQTALKTWASVRDYDLIGRWGETGFMLILPETSLSGATIVAERIRDNVNSVPLRIEEDTQIKLSISMGVVQANSQEYISVDDVITSAENSLANAEKAGGNNIVFSWNA